jgi:hypothetical protein
VQEIVSYLRWIPLVGGFAAGVVNLGISVAAVTATIVCACGVIGTSWLAHRPALAYTLFAVSAGTYAWAWMSQRGRERTAAPDSTDDSTAADDASTNTAGDGDGDEARDDAPTPDYNPPNLD